MKMVNLKDWLLTGQSTAVKTLAKENEELKRKLEEKQLHINRTNAYWKGVVRKMRSGARNVAIF